MRGMQTIVDKVKAADPARLAAIKVRLLSCCDGADRVAGPAMRNWREAIEHLDTEPERLLGCNSILHDLIAQAIEQKV